MRLQLGKGRPKDTGKLAPYAGFLLGVIEEKSDITMPQLYARLFGTHGVTTAPASLSRLLRRHGLTYEKKP